MSSQWVPHSWRKTAGSRPRKSQPRLSRPPDNKKKTPWSNRHHVLVSKSNEGKTPHQRLYFDSAPHVTIRHGKYIECPLVQLAEWEDPNGHSIRMMNRFQQFPQQAKEASRHKWRPTAAAMFSSLLPGFSYEPKTSHSYSFPSWSENASVVLPTMSEAAAAGSSSAFSSEAGVDAESKTPRSTIKPEEVRRSGTAGSNLGAPRKRTMTAGSDASQPEGVRRAKSGTFGMRPSMHQGLAPEKEVQLTIFNEWVATKFGDMLAIWRKLDKDGNMSLSKTEFLKGLIDLGYPGKATTLWSALDSDTTGLITITECVPIAALQLAKFKHWAEEKFGSVQSSFLHFDKDRNGQMTFEEFKSGCFEAGIPDELKSSLETMFDAVDDSKFGKGSNSITRDEIKFLDAWKCPEYLWTAPDEGAKDAFHKFLLKRHGVNNLVAWRKGLDRDGTMRVNFSEFTLLCKRLAKQGVQVVSANEVPALFCAFDPSRRGWFSLRDWDAKSWELLASFRRWAQTKFGKVSECFRAWGADPNAGMSFHTFKKNVKEMGLNIDQKEWLFEGLSLEPEAWNDEIGDYAYGKLRRDEIVFLDSWDPDEEWQEVLAWEEQFKEMDSSGDPCYIDPAVALAQKRSHSKRSMRM